MNNDIAILVVSCDNYSDLWSPFFECFRRFWPDCPYNIYLVSNNKLGNFDGVEPILTGDDVSWSDNLIIALRQVRQKYVLLFIEDLFLSKSVNTQEVKNLFAWANANEINYLRCRRLLNNGDKDYDDKVEIISKGQLYRTSTVMSFWNKDVLMDLLKSGESAWQFEYFGTERSDKYSDFYVVKKSLFKTINTVIKGKWDRKSLKEVQSLGVKIELDKREVMNFGEFIKFKCLLFRSHLIACFPGDYRRKIKRFFGGGEYK